MAHPRCHKTRGLVASPIEKCPDRFGPGHVPSDVQIVAEDKIVESVPANIPGVVVRGLSQRQPAHRENPHEAYSHLQGSPRTLAHPIPLVRDCTQLTLELGPSSFFEGSTAIFGKPPVITPFSSWVVWIKPLTVAVSVSTPGRCW